MPAGEVTVRLNLNKDGYSAGMTAARREAQQTVKTIQDMGHTTVSQMQAASASIRVLEGGMTGNIRAAERFISTIPGVGRALQAAFPAVGAIALAGVFVKIAEEATKAIQKVNQAEQQISNSFRTLNLSGQTANDTLAITNDRLENEIAKLQGRPQNNLRIAIDEARKAADVMADSLDRDNAKIKELLSQNAVPWWAGFLGKAGTSNVSDTINKQNQHLADLAAQANVLQHQGDQGGADRLRGEIDSTRQQYLQQNNQDIANRRANQNLAGGLNQGANIAALYGQQGSLYNQVDQESGLKRNVADEAQKQKLEDANKYAELQKQAQAQLLKQMQEGLAQQRAQYGVSVAEELAYWSARISAFTKGGEQFHTVQMEQFKLQADLYQQMMEGKKKYLDASKSEVEGNDLLGKGAEAFTKINLEQMEEASRAAEKYYEIIAKGNEIAAKQAAQFKESSVAIGLENGTLSKLGAAQELARIHAQEHADAIAEVNRQLAKQIELINSDPKMSAQEKTDAVRNATATAGNQVTEINGAYAVQSAQDQQKVASQQFIPAMQNALRVMSQDWTNMTQQIVQIMTKSIDSLNDDIVKAMTGQGKKGDFGRTFLQAGQGLVKTGLQGVEGNVLKMFHIGEGKTGKPDGSKDNPYHVVPAGSDGTSGSSDDSGTASGLGGIMGKIAPFIQPFIPHFAAGGDVLANRPALVGENGPELFMPGSSGRIVPNNKLGGGSSGHTFNIDARGSNDPMAVEAAVRRALPHAVSASVQATHQNRMRSPGGR